MLKVVQTFNARAIWLLLRCSVCQVHRGCTRRLTASGHPRADTRRVRCVLARTIQFSKNQPWPFRAVPLEPPLAREPSKVTTTRRPCQALSSGPPVRLRGSPPTSHRLGNLSNLPQAPDPCQPPSAGPLVAAHSPPARRRFGEPSNVTLPGSSCQPPTGPAPLRRRPAGNGAQTRNRSGRAGAMSASRRGPRQGGKTLYDAGPAVSTAWKHQAHGPKPLTPAPAPPPQRFG